MKIRLLVAYDGTAFCGWQRQGRKDVPSVQATLEDALGQIFQQKIVLFASGRTDAGVHALGQVCDFNVDVSEERMRRFDICWSVRALLPPTLVVRKAWIAPPEFHSTLSATHKTYKYFIYNHPRSNPFLRLTSDWIRRPLNLEHLNESSQYLLGTHDFKSLQSVGTPVVSTVRHIYEAKWQKRSRNVLQFTVTGQGFLKQMVRNIVGTQLMLEKEGRNPSEMKRIIESLDRRQAGAPAPPGGLFLWKVYYPTDLDIRCRPL